MRRLSLRREVTLGLAVYGPYLLVARSCSVARGVSARKYMPIVATVVAATGNHYVLDAVAGTGLGAAARRLS